MSLYRVIAFVVILALFSWHCNSSADKKEMTENIAKLEEELKADSTGSDLNNVNKMIEAYNNYAVHFPEEKHSPEYLFRAANLYIRLKDFIKATEYLERINNGYKDYGKAPEALYLTGFIYEYHLQSFGKASEVYREVINRYPQHPVAMDADASIRLLNKSDEEVLQMLKEKNRAGEE